MKLQVIKIGGEVIDDAQMLHRFLEDFSALKNPKILVHGGGKVASNLSKQLGLTPNFVNGRRITQSADLEVVVMAYAGKLNKSLVSKLQKIGCNAIGISGADGDSVRTAKRVQSPVDYGLVGDITKVNGQLINQLIKANLTPVFCAITHDGNGQLLNTNADTMAAAIASTMNMFFETELVYCFEKQGVLSDIKQPDSVIQEISQKKYTALLKDKQIYEGMLPKLENCFKALKNGVKSVKIGSYKMLTEDTNNHTKLVL
ncbi:acetylglutamate kinase [Fulvivirga aurantia]|uniref:acetylglutamate kinase n=1 Tax=Fulvivirga aurantia TaxID=2529383 RepID=UPI0012BCC0D1|nr:acetylglutamate kinase [Fulvivirga aurantia]